MHGRGKNNTVQSMDIVRYSAKKTQRKISINGDPSKSIWQEAAWAELKNYLGPIPEPFPRVTVKIGYDEEALYLFFNVSDQYVKAVHKGYQAEVWKDSCVEFFFIPGDDLALGYFNLEVNCGGSALFQYRKNSYCTEIDEQDFNQISIYHSLPEVIQKEIETPVNWTIEYRLPFKILENYCRLTRPKKGIKWRMNLYKCADETSHPHWLTWNRIVSSKPNFHVPEFFGRLHFE